MTALIHKHPSLYARVLYISSPSLLLLCTVQLAVDAETEHDAVIGETTSLLCEVSEPAGSPTLTWFKVVGGVEVEKEEQDFGDPWFGNLTIQNVEREDAGVYICRARNQFSNQEATIQLFVLSKSHVANVRDKHSFRDILCLSCFKVFAI